ncbi:transmembrane protease serine 12 isoform X2 [Columba livia]|uniref:transmembrane protease serine 12 isoform X2 n=1 Tax=Columba livia TaxID=8932 RepID=UPI0031BAEF7F
MWWGRFTAARLLRLLVLASVVPRVEALGPEPEECGERPLLDGPSGSRVVGGQDARAGAWPWSVSLQLRPPGAPHTHVCGGVLITDRAVLTAGHCVTGRRDPYYWRAVLGMNNLWRYSKHAVKRRIRSITVHPEFKRETFENDIAVFELSYAVRFSDYIQPICFPPAHLYPHIANETLCFISGWGRTEEKGQTSSVLKEAQVEIIPSSVCNSSDAYGGLVNSNMLCAGSRTGGIDTCQGDSGGPLACYHPATNKHYLVGIASFGVGCGRPKFPGIYVRLSQYRTWINMELLMINKAANPASATLTILLTLIRVLSEAAGLVGDPEGRCSLCWVNTQSVRLAAAQLTETRQGKRNLQKKVVSTNYLE